MQLFFNIMHFFLDKTFFMVYNKAKKKEKGDKLKYEQIPIGHKS